jgi:hypothetical protein
LTWARGSLPTPLGQIDVDWKQSEDRFVLNVNAPETMALKIVLPAAAQQIEVNDQLIWRQEQIMDANHDWSVEQVNGETRLSCGRGGSFLIAATKK